MLLFIYFPKRISVSELFLCPEFLQSVKFPDKYNEDDMIGLGLWDKMAISVLPITVLASLQFVKNLNRLMEADCVISPDGAFLIVNKIIWLS